MKSFIKIHKFSLLPLILLIFMTSQLQAKDGFSLGAGFTWHIDNSYNQNSKNSYASSEDYGNVSGQDMLILGIDLNASYNFFDNYFIRIDFDYCKSAKDQKAEYNDSLGYSVEEKREYSSIFIPFTFGISFTPLKDKSNPVIYLGMGLTFIHFGINRQTIYQNPASTDVDYKCKGKGIIPHILTGFNIMLNQNAGIYFEVQEYFTGGIYSDSSKNSVTGTGHSSISLKPNASIRLGALYNF